MNHETLQIVGVVLLVIGLLSLVGAIVMFITFKIPELWKDMSGASEQQKIAEIRYKNSSFRQQQKEKINVFEELEKRNASKRKTGRLNEDNVPMATSAMLENKNIQTNSDTVVLQESAKAINSDFVIEKNIMFVSTSEVI